MTDNPRNPEIAAVRQLNELPDGPASLIATATTPDGRSAMHWKLPSGEVVEVVRPSPLIRMSVAGTSQFHDGTDDDDENRKLAELCQSLKDCGLVIPDGIRNIGDLVIAIKANQGGDDQDEELDLDEIERTQPPISMSHTRGRRVRRHGVRLSHQGGTRMTRKQRADAFFGLIGGGRPTPTAE